MEHYKTQSELKSGTFRPYSGSLSCNLKIKIPKKVEEEEDDPITPGSNASAYPGWYKFPFPYIEPEKEILYFE